MCFSVFAGNCVILRIHFIKMASKVNINAKFYKWEVVALLVARVLFFDKDAAKIKA